MVLWILLAVVAVVVIVWMVRRPGHESHADPDEVTRTRGRDEGRGIGPTGV